MVTNEEIKQMLDAKRKGIDIKKDKIKSENYKICPHCKTKNPEKALFCVHCGRKLDKNLDIQCPSCGIKNAKTAKFCVGCGETLKEEEKEISETTVIKDDEMKEKSSPIEDSKSSAKNIINKPESDELEKPIKAGVPSSVPEHNIISKTGLKKTCPSCNGKNLKNAKFCVVCGKKFDEEETESPVVENETVKELPSLTDNVNDSEQEINEKSSTQTPSSEIKVPENIIRLKNTRKTEEIDNEKNTNNIPDEIESKKSEQNTDIVDPVERIKKAKELLDIGAITSEEFENIKKKYIELI
ncbi:zinc ribbon domain-containing protein [Methanobacterium sp. SMA-27]|uniref:double zinc ribbon domain-containing protein n=1 Tax=Methanobacterium sp. SMA-27 TaxID=1495336 RepID=UPI00064FA3D0|nr:zinc ribbon domain-containing protein [Methanobacterium sp. SMA-27]